MKNESIKQRPKSTEARSIVVPREETDALRSGNVFPIAAAFENDRAGIGRTELQRRGAAVVREVSLACGFTFARDLDSKSDARGVEEALRFGFVSLWQVFNVREAEIPLLVEFRSLRVRPESVHRRADK